MHSLFDKSFCSIETFKNIGQNGTCFKYYVPLAFTQTINQKLIKYDMNEIVNFLSYFGFT